jgi:hypothetical protein
LLKVKDRAFPCTLMETELKDPKRSVKTWFCPALPLGAVKTESEGTASALIDFGEDWGKRPPFPEAPVIAKVDPPKPPPPPPPPPPKPEPIKPEPPKPEPVKPPPPPPPKPEPVKPEPPNPEPIKPEPVKPEPPKPPPPPPPPPKPEPVNPEPKPEPRKEEAPARVKKSMVDAAALIREATPMYQEVASAMDSLPKDRPSLVGLVDKAERVSLKLSDAKILYASVKADAPDPAVLDRRVAQLDDLLAAIQDFVRQLKKKIE